MGSGGDGEGGKTGEGGEGGKTCAGGEGGTGEGGKVDGTGKGTGEAIDHAGAVAGSNCSNETAAVPLPIAELAKNLRCIRCCCLKRKLRRLYTVITPPRRRRPAKKLTTLCENIFSHPSPALGTER